jgi:acyl carrier protein
MATQAEKDAAERYVLDYFRRRWPNVTVDTTLRSNLHLDEYDIYDIGRELRGWRGTTYKPSEFAKCKTIKAIVALIVSKLP